MKQSHVYTSGSFVKSSVLISGQNDFEVRSVTFLTLISELGSFKVVVVSGTGNTGSFTEPFDIEHVALTTHHLLNDHIFDVGWNLHWVDSPDPKDTIFLETQSPGPYTSAVF